MPSSRRRTTSEKHRHWNLIDELLEAGARVRVFDPEAMDNVRRIIGEEKAYFAKDPYDVLEGCDALAIVTEWSEFRNPDFERMSGLLKHPAIFDGRNVYTLSKMERLGFYYQSIGRRTIHPQLRPAVEERPEQIVRSRGL